MTTCELLTLLRAKYAPPEWALLSEVGNATGTHCRRHADAIAMSLWPSRGLHLHGFELKVSRSDWTRERKDPAKAEEIAKHCHFWWIVAPKGIVPAAEVPANWGLIETAGGGLRITKSAAMLEPVALNWSFVAAVMRRCTEQSVDAGLLSEEYRRGYQAAVQFQQESDQRQADRENRQRERAESELKHAVEKFERESGLSVRTWQAGNVGAAVRLVLKETDVVAAVRRNLLDVIQTAEKARELIAALDAVPSNQGAA